MHASVICGAVGNTAWVVGGFFCLFGLLNRDPAFFLLGRLGREVGRRFPFD